MLQYKGTEHLPQCLNPLHGFILDSFPVYQNEKVRKANSVCTKLYSHMLSSQEMVLLSKNCIKNRI